MPTDERTTRGCSAECEIRQLKAWMARWVVSVVLVVTVWCGLVVGHAYLFGLW